MNDLDIRKIREKLGVSQESLAEMIGVHPRTIQNWESGSTIPKSKHAILRDLVIKPQQYAGGEQSNVNGNNINGNNVTVNNQPDTIEKLLDILAMKEASLAKAQEHIDKLLEIIGNITQKGNSND
jgi:predicted transcriptional regulator|nr:MAG TPA: putative zinc finger/helix-turn-helix protein, YgiT family [Caudoviricetes sp.]